MSVANASYNTDTGAEFNFQDAKLSQKFGPEVTNYFSGSPLNRVSFLRDKPPFLSAALPQAKYLLLNSALDPLSASPKRLAYASYEDVKPLIGNPYDVSEEEFINSYDSRLAQPPQLIFLGIDEYDKESGFVYGAEGSASRYEGRAYFAVGVEDWVPTGIEGEWRKTRLNLNLARSDAAILAQARSIMDWNNRNKFCSACGSPTISVNAGTKRVCPPYDKALQKSADATPAERPPCISRKGVHNIAFPRTDPTVIMAIVNSTGDKVLLGRQRRWPEHFYSCLAGFCEPAESVEEAVRRETWEESGVRVGRVVVHSSQPWPYPNSLMLGCVGEALPDGEQIHLGHDPELHQAEWFPISFIREMLKRPAAGLDEGTPEGFQEGDIRLPPATAIASQLLVAITNNYHGGLKI